MNIDLNYDCSEYWSEYFRDWYGKDGNILKGEFQTNATNVSISFRKCEKEIINAVRMFKDGKWCMC